MNNNKKIRNHLLQFDDGMDSSNLEILINGGGQGRFGHSPNYALSLLPILEEQNRGNASDPIFRGHIRANVRIQLQTHDFPCIFLRQILNHWLDHLTRSTPRRPKLHQHSLLTAHHQLVPARLCNLFHCNFCVKTESNLQTPQGRKTKMFVLKIRYTDKNWMEGDRSVTNRRQRLRELYR